MEGSINLGQSIIDNNVGQKRKEGLINLCEIGKGALSRDGRRQSVNGFKV